MLPTLTPIQARVLGALAEKAATVPETYPMTLNGLQSACNQRNSREPVTEYDSGEITRTLDGLKADGLVRFVHPSGGARSTKYRHVLDEQLDLDPGELALVTVLLLRGPQTLAELRTRTERAFAFDDVNQVDATLTALASRQAPVVVHLERRPGQKETRWMHLLAGEFVDDAPIAMASASDTSATVAPTAPQDPALSARVASLEAQVEAMTRFLGDLGYAP